MNPAKVVFSRVSVPFLLCFVEAPVHTASLMFTAGVLINAVCGLQDPLAIIGILGILLPFVIVGALVALGVIDPNPTGR